MIKEVTMQKTTFNDLPYKFEAGTPNIADVIAFKSALHFVQSIGKEKIRRHERDLMDYGHQELEKIPGLKIIGKAKEKVSVISFVIEKAHPQDIGILLDNRGIAVRTGHHCAQPLMDHFCIPGTARASFAVYNTRYEIDELVKGLLRVVKILS
jgi:cysteine desulfurase / selenocysteine lyase